MKKWLIWFFSAVIVLSSVPFTLLNSSVVHASATAPLPYSSTFANWTVGRSGSIDAAFTATLNGHTGAALSIVNQTPKTSNTFAQIYQTVTVKPSTLYRFSAWVASDGLPSSGALQAILSDDWGIRYSFPSGTYAWRQVTWTYTTTSSQTSMTLRLLTQDVTPVVRIDDMTMVENGTTQNLLSNGGFEEHSYYFGVSNSTLLFDPGTAAINFITDAPNPTSASWTVRDVRGLPVKNGTAAYTDGKAAVDLSSLSNGFYTIEATSTADNGPMNLSTSFGVVPSMPAAANSFGSPFGVGIHGFDSTVIAGLSRIGMKHARTDASWSSVEKSPGVYTFPSTLTDGFAALYNAGIEPLPISDYRNTLYDNNLTPSSPEGLAAYGNYTAALNDQFKNYTQATEVYNEFNINFNDGKCGRTPACYAQLLNAAGAAVKAKNLNGQLVGPAISGASEDFVKQVLQGGGSNILSAVSIHPYRHPQAPEGMEKQMASMVKAIKDTAGKDIPLWLTEFGWPTNTPVNGITDVMQADYLVRSSVLSLAGGVARLYWYDARDDGTDPNNQEHNFGLFEVRRAASVNAAEPKVSAVAQAVMAAELAGKTLTGRDSLDESTYSYVFGTGSDATRVMWAPSGGKTVTLSTYQPLTFTDEFGAQSTLTPYAGAVNVALTEHPVYVTGAPTAVALGTAPGVMLQTTSTVAKGESIEVRAVVDRSGSNCQSIPSTVTFNMEGMQKEVQVNGCTVGEAIFHLPTTALQTSSWVTGTASMNGGQFASLATSAISITQAITATVDLQLVRDGDNYAEQAVISVANKSRVTPVTLNNIAWKVGSQSGTINETSTIQAGKSIQRTLPLSSLQLWKQGYLDLSVGVHNMDPVTLRQSVGIGPIEPDSSAAVAPIDLATDAAWQKYTADWGGASDLSGTVKITETLNGVHFHAEVQDNVFRQTNPAGNMYNGDSIQLSFSPGQPGASQERTEIGFALTPSGPDAYTFAATGLAVTGRTPTDSLSVTRVGTTTTYDAVIPWQSFGLTAAPEGTFALSFLVNDDDGSGRKGFLEWSSGIGRTKDTNAHFPVQLTSRLLVPDVIAPASVAQISPEVPTGSQGWYKSDVTVDISATDDLSGVAKTEFSLDHGETWTPYTEPVTLNQDGIYEVQYHSTDKAGNVEVVNSTTIHIDKTAPTALLTANGHPLNDGMALQDNQSIILAMQVADNLSGMAEQSIQVDGIPYAPGTTLDWAGNLGQHVVSVMLKDTAGNTSQTVIQINVSANIDSLKALMDRFTEQGELGGPMLTQLSNKLIQALDQLNKNHPAQAIKHMQDFLDVMNNQGLQSHISVKAKSVLTADAKAVIAVGRIN
ncbi:OmpL47-type beta-barrel domain-containing protein [Paenibacillus whitsoniae]|uniref:Uncharacterized protein n=1 Tax=Paenibacillus whitsoniae TaxID=2496558 RepID=A0A430JCU2_9BACL|nr:sugar-binding protein [Paenibacillus whitsoniae]RTE08892.1 hypothetical protein EJQ19_15345 [Paenibacillus whitsoniae]